MRPRLLPAVAVPVLLPFAACGDDDIRTAAADPTVTTAGGVPTTTEGALDEAATAHLAATGLR